MSRTNTLPEMRGEVRRKPRSKAAQKIGPLAAGKKATAALCVSLAVATIALYSPVIGDRFLIFDDHDYVTANPHIHNGLSWSTIKWAFTSTEFANWHPLTWLSHALDYQLFGLEPAGHHLHSVLIHSLNVVLLFLFLRWTTKRAGPSFLVVALFAVHPINVESVAWTAERKNVLSTFLFFLAIIAYVWYTRRPGWVRYFLVAALFAMGLMAKPMVVTLPCVLLLLDFWPLCRDLGSSSSPLCIPQLSVSRLLLEKVPLLVLSAASGAITVKAQRAGLAVRTLGQFSFAVRVENAAVAYGMYLRKMIWPEGLAPLYPHPGDSLPKWQVALSAIVLVSVSATVVAFRRRRHLPAGWLWFLGTLVPVIGLVQVGDAARADRYAYIPLIGIFVMIAYGLADLAEARKVRRAWQVVPAACVLAAFVLLTHRQLSYWDSEYHLWSHTLAVTPQNPFAHDALAAALLEPDVAMTQADMENLDTDQKRMDAARRHYEAALNIRRPLARQHPTRYLPDMASTLNNLGNLDRAQQNAQAARGHYEEALAIHHQLAQQNRDPYLPDMAMALDNLGLLDKAEKRMDEAHQQFEEALKVYRKLAEQQPSTYLPDLATTLNNLAVTEKEQNRTGESRPHYEEALKIRRQLAQNSPETYLPDVAMTLNDLGGLDLLQQRMAESRLHYEEASKLYHELAQQSPDSYEPFLAGTLNNLGFLDRNQDRIEESRAHYTDALVIYRMLAKKDRERYAGDIARVEAALQELAPKSPSK